MHFWIDKRSQANINQCRANARLTLNRLQPLEYVRPPHQNHHNHHTSSNSNSSTNRNNNNYHFNYSDSSNNNNNNTNNNNNNNINNNNSNNNNNNNNNSNSIFRNSLNRNNNRTNHNNNNNIISNQSNSSGNTAHNSNMINTAATGSAHTSYRIPHHQNIDIDQTFGPNDQHNSQEPVIRAQPHLRWQVLVIFTFFVVTIRFYVLGNRSEVLIYCISGLILVMALLIFSALNLQKKLTTGNSNYNSTSPRFDGVQHTRLISTSTRVNGSNNTMGGGNSSGHHHHPSEQQISSANRCPYVQQLVLQNAGTLGRNGTNHRDAQILAEAVVLLPPSPTHLLQDPTDVRRNHSENSIAPPPYDKAILLPNNDKNKKFIGIEIESSEDETPPPSYAAVTDINN